MIQNPSFFAMKRLNSIGNTITKFFGLKHQYLHEILKTFNSIIVASCSTEEPFHQKMTLQQN